VDELAHGGDWVDSRFMKTSRNLSQKSGNKISQLVINVFVPERKLCPGNALQDTEGRTSFTAFSSPYVPLHFASLGEPQQQVSRTVICIDAPISSCRELLQLYLSWNIATLHTSSFHKSLIVEPSRNRHARSRTSHPTMASLEPHDGHYLWNIP
jgi:hypothetical protein